LISKGRSFKKILKYRISWKSVQWESSCSIRNDGQADRHDKDSTPCSQCSKRA